MKLQLDYGVIAQNIKNYREKAHWTRAKLAKEASVKAAQIYRYEKNRSKPSEITIRKLAQAIGISYELMITESSDKSVTQIDKQLLKTKFEEMIELEISENERFAVFQVLDLVIYKRKIQSLK